MFIKAYQNNMKLDFDEVMDLKISDSIGPLDYDSSDDDDDHYHDDHDYDIIIIIT